MMFLIEHRVGDAAFDTIVAHVAAGVPVPRASLAIAKLRWVTVLAVEREPEVELAALIRAAAYERAAALAFQKYGPELYGFLVNHFGAEYVAATPSSDPLFTRIDADDPSLTVPTYNHLAAGLVRITIKLADNLDVIDATGTVITNADRTISVWRGVPSIENVAYTAPYQYDGRAPTLRVQALGALRLHSQIDRDPHYDDLKQIASFEKTVFSSQAAEAVILNGGLLNKSKSAK
ncbi:MAG: hypothetical protein ABI704_27775 [Kofleriaceae bacterium]